MKATIQIFHDKTFSLFENADEIQKEKLPFNKRRTWEVEKKQMMNFNNSAKYQN